MNEFGSLCEGGMKEFGGSWRLGQESGPDALLKLLGSQWGPRWLGIGLVGFCRGIAWFAESSYQLNVYVIIIS